LPYLAEAPGSSRRQRAEGDEDLAGALAHRRERAAEGTTVDDDSQVVCLRFVLL
jgi:hypothetical protein